MTYTITNTGNFTTTEQKANAINKAKEAVEKDGYKVIALYGYRTEMIEDMLFYTIGFEAEKIKTD